MENNPYFVAPANIFQVLMAGQQGYDKARARTKENEMNAAWQTAGNQIATGGVSNASLGQIIGMGPQAAPLVQAISTFGKADTTNDLKNLAAENKTRSERGLPPLSVLEYEKTLRQAGANSTTVNMPPQEKAYDAAIGKELAELNVGIIKGASSARSNLANIDRLDQLLGDPGIYQGTGGEKVLQAKKLAKSIGIDVGDLGGAEAAQAISNQLALQARNPAGGAGMPGAMSDPDREYLRSMQPGIEKTPEGNRQIIDVNRKLNQRAIDVETQRQNYIRKNGRLNEGFYRELNDWSNQNPLFAGAQRPGQAQAPQRGAAPNAPVARPANMPDARQGYDGGWYVPDPSRPGKYMRVVQ